MSASAPATLRIAPGGAGLAEVVQQGAQHEDDVALFVAAAQLASSGKHPPGVYPGITFRVGIGALGYSLQGTEFGKSGNGAGQDETIPGPDQILAAQEQCLPFFAYAFLGDFLQARRQLAAECGAPGFNRKTQLACQPGRAENAQRVFPKSVGRHYAEPPE